jgi:uncharacterized cupredoxin-like copper-binding protein
VIRLLLTIAPIAIAAAVFIAGRGGDGGPQRATIDIHFSHFMHEAITVRAGEPVEITLRNDDPIEHEWIVGTAEVHARHRTGTEPYHGTIPSEVSVPPLSTRTTTLTFPEPGDYQYICHLPGHEEYGMVGTVHVQAR